MPSPPPLAAAEPVNTNGRYGCASCHAGTAVCDNRTAVYDATPGADRRRPQPAGRANQLDQPTQPRPPQTLWHQLRHPGQPRAGPYADRIHVPILIGELGFATRSM